MYKRQAQRRKDLVLQFFSARSETVPEDSDKDFMLILQRKIVPGLRDLLVSDPGAGATFAGQLPPSLREVFRPPALRTTSSVAFRQAWTLYRPRLTLGTMSLEKQTQLWEWASSRNWPKSWRMPSDLPHYFGNPVFPRLFADMDARVVDQTLEGVANTVPGQKPE